MTERCDNCKFWDAYNLTTVPEKEGRCSRYPRVVVTSAEYSCGEWVQKLSIPPQVKPKGGKK